MDVRHSDASKRNKDPILEVLREVLPDDPNVLEIGSGTGQHAMYFARHLEGVVWQPADRPGRTNSVEARRRRAELENVREPLELDLFDDEWPVDSVDALVAINVLHIAPWSATERLFEHAARVVRPGGIVYVYGPFRYRDRELEPSNQRFDEMLQSRDPEMGLREVGAVRERAAGHGFEFLEDRAMPANNRSLIWRNDDE
jgi:SAM-dependent methyltransferase